MDGMQWPARVDYSCSALKIVCMGMFRGRENVKRPSMLIKFSGLALALVMLASAPDARAEPDYTAQDIIDRFTAQSAAEGGQPRSGTRSVFIGASGYGAQTAAAEDDPRFNLMITFGFDSDQLTAGARRNLDEFARAVSDPALQDLRFLIAGHTDSRGSDAYNMALSQRRAETVVSYLVGKGVVSGRLVAKGFGETEPIGENADSEENRRVEARIAE